MSDGYLLFNVFVSCQRFILAHFLSFVNPRVFTKLTKLINNASMQRGAGVDVAFRANTVISTRTVAVACLPVRTLVASPILI